MSIDKKKNIWKKKKKKKPLEILLMKIIYIDLFI